MMRLTPLLGTLVWIWSWSQAELPVHTVQGAGHVTVAVPPCPPPPQLEGQAVAVGRGVAVGRAVGLGTAVGIGTGVWEFGTGGAPGITPGVQAGMVSVGNTALWRTVLLVD